MNPCDFRPVIRSSYLAVPRDTNGNYRGRRLYRRRTQLCVVFSYLPWAISCFFSLSVSCRSLFSILSQIEPFKKAQPSQHTLAKRRPNPFTREGSTTGFAARSAEARSRAARLLLRASTGPPSCESAQELLLSWWLNNTMRILWIFTKYGYLGKAAVSRQQARQSWLGTVNKWSILRDMDRGHLHSSKSDA